MGEFSLHSLASSTGPLFTLCMCARGKVIGHVYLSSLLSVCRHQKWPVLQTKGVLLVLNTFKLCKTLKTCLVCAFFFARYTLQVLK